MDHDRSESLARRELEDHLLNRALRDDEFRSLLVANPKGAVEAEIRRLHLGISLPPALKIEVLEESADTLYLILPPSLVGNAPTEDDFFLKAIQSLNMGDSSDEPS